MIRSHFGVLAIAATVVLTGCGDDKKAQAPTTLTIAIGSVAPLTGGIAHLGKDNENGARLAVEEAKAEKIRIGGKEAVFEFLAEDDQEDAKVGNTVAQKLVDAKVAGVVGHLNSGTSIPASPIYNQAGIPVISGSATNPKLTEQGFKTQFRVVGRDDQQGPAIANYLASNTKPKLVADKKFLDAYKKKYGVDPIIYSPFTYDSTNLLIEAMKKANSADPAKYLPELQKISYTGATGPISFDEKGDRKDAEITIFTMKSGKLDPTAVYKGGKVVPYQDFIKTASK